MQVAEKRKTLIDELAIKYQQDADRHKEQTTTMCSRHMDRVNELIDQNNQLNVCIVNSAINSAAMQHCILCHSDHQFM